MKHVGLFIILLFFLSSCNNQAKSSEYAEIIKGQAETMGKLLIKKDFTSFIEFTYPKVVEMMGGKQNMIETMRKGSEGMSSEGTELLKVTFGEPSEIITENNELQCTLSQTIEMNVSGGRLISKSTLIAISTNNGENWYFLDASGKDIQTMKKMLPNLSENLVIPRQQQPTFIKD